MYLPVLTSQMTDYVKLIPTAAPGPQVALDSFEGSPAQIHQLP